MNKNVLLLLANGFEELEAAAFTDVMGWSRTDGIEAVGLKTAALSPEIRGTWNLIVKPEMLVKDVRVEEFDALAIPGGFEEAGFYEDAYAEEFLDVVRRFDAADKAVASVCVGAMPLGKSGILENRPATTYHLLDSVRPAQLAEFGVNVEKTHIVIDGKTITSCGPSTALDVAFTLLGMLTSEDNVSVVRKAMGFDA